MAETLNLLSHFFSSKVYILLITKSYIRLDVKFTMKILKLEMAPNIHPIMKMCKDPQNLFVNSNYLDKLESENFWVLNPKTYAADLV